MKLFNEREAADFAFFFLLLFVIIRIHQNFTLPISGVVCGVCLGRCCTSAIWIGY